MNGSRIIYAQSSDSVLARKYYEDGLSKIKNSEPLESNKVLIKSAGLYQRLGLKEKYVSCQIAIASNLKLMSEFDKSEAVSIAALAYIKENKLAWFSSAKFFKLLGQIKSRVGDYKGAEQYFQKALSHPLHVKIDSVFTGKVYNDLGNLSLRKHDLERAIQYFNNSIPLLKEPSDKNLTKGNIAIIYIEMGNYSRAISMLNEVIEDEIETSGEKSPTLGNHYINLGRCHSDIFDSYKALEYFQKALDLFGSNPTHPAVAKILNNMGIVYLDTKDYEKARLYFDSAVALNLKFFPKGYEDFARVYNNIGACYMEQKDYVKTMHYYNRALANNILNADTFMVIRSYNKIGRVKMLEQKHDEALVFFNKAITLGSQLKFYSETEVTHQYKASIQASRKNYEEAIQSVNAAIGTLVPTFKPKQMHDFPESTTLFVSYTLLELITNKALYIKELADERKDVKLFLSALAAHESAIGFLEKLDEAYLDDRSKASLRRNFLTVFEDAIEICCELYGKTKNEKYLEKAVFFSEKNKATRLRQALRHQYAIRFSDIPDSLVAKEADLRVLISYYEQKILDDGANVNKEVEDKLFNLKNKYARLIALFKKEYSKFYELKYKSEVAGVKDIQSQLLGDKSVMIKYFVGDRSYYAFVITKQTLKIHTLSSPENISELSDKLLQAIRDQDYKSYTASAYALYSKLIKPLNLDVDVKHLVIIPDGKLYYVPFETFIKTLPQNTTQVADLAFLVRDYSFQYHVSATVMIENSSHHEVKASKRFAAFAPIDFNPQLKIPALFGSEVEVRNAAEKMNGDCLVRNQATESAFKNAAGSYAILHLATHAILDDMNPIKSKLLFSTAEDSVNDGALFGHELYNLHLNANLVTLSACNTGRGKLEEGEGVISLARSFMYAGSQSLLMSLWPASDNASQTVMTFFYEELSEGKSKAEALQQAKIRYLDQADELSNDPFLWSNFVLVGDDNTFNEPFLFSRIKRPIVTISNMASIIALILSAVTIILTVCYLRVRKRRMPN